MLNMRISCIGDMILENASTFIRLGQESKMEQNNDIIKLVFRSDPGSLIEPPTGESRHLVFNAPSTKTFPRVWSHDLKWVN